jgi:hypothetical protein
VRRLLRKREEEGGEKQGCPPRVCKHVAVETVGSDVVGVRGSQICLISRVEYDFFAPEDQTL